MRLFRKRVEPVPPEDVRAVMADGRHIPIECVYIGRHNGLHVWRAVHVPTECPVRVQVAMMPGHTSVEMVHGGDWR